MITSYTVYLHYLYCVCVSFLQPISLSWWPLFRDAVFYILSIVVLILVRNPPVEKSTHTGLFVWQEINFVLCETLEQKNQFALSQPELKV